MLRGILVFEAVVLALFLPMAAARLGVIAAVAVLLVAFLSVQAIILASAYGTALRHASPRPAGVGPLTAGAVIAEFLAFVALFVAIMPFERVWMGRDAVGRLAPGRLPALLVHGYMCNRGYWWWIRRRLRAEGLAVATVNLETPISDIEDLADLVDRRITALVAETGAARVVLVTHSMGGLVGRALMRRHGTGRIARFVTLAGPHHGTVAALRGIGSNARQMRPGNPWLAELNRAEDPGVATTSVWSAGDEIIAPQDSSRLAGAREVVLPAIGHVAMAFSPVIAGLVAAEAAEAEAAARAALVIPDPADRFAMPDPTRRKSPCSDGASSTNGIRNPN